MGQVMVSPEWFITKDILICIFSMITLLLIAMFSLKFYFFRKQENKNYLYFASSFILLAASFLCKILTNVTIFYHVVETKKLDFVTITYQTLKSSKFLFLAGHFMHYFLLLIGLYILYVTLSKKSTMNHLLILYFLLITIVFTNLAYFVFNLTAFILLCFIVCQYYIICRENRSKITKLLFTSFSIIAISQAIFMFTKYDTNVYVAAQLVQLVGFLILLTAFILVLKHGKTKQNRHNK